LPSVLETIDSVSSALGTLPVIGLPLDYYQKLPDRIRAVTLEEANRVARAYIQADKWPAIVVGPQGQFGEKMKELQIGPVEQQPAP
ncbi:MAG TPA: hypothetical protein VK447_20330, partial [Myxococcaceae bacterium]|nr:hypothetical protein [Myxococcaceae bacterium]